MIRITLWPRNISNQGANSTYGFKVRVDDIRRLAAEVPEIRGHSNAGGFARGLRVSVPVQLHLRGQSLAKNLSITYTGPLSGSTESLQGHIAISDAAMRSWIIKNPDKRIEVDAAVTDDGLVMFDGTSARSSLKNAVGAAESARLVRVGLDPVEAMRRGALGEALADTIIRKRWRRSEVEHVSVTAPFSPFDFRVTTAAQETRFVEVKATTRSDGTAILSEPERRFRAQNAPMHHVLVLLLSDGGLEPLRRLWWLNDDGEFKLTPIQHYLLPLVAGRDTV